MQTLAEYCRPFKDANAIWPSLPVCADARERWWRQWLNHSRAERPWDALRLLLPQLLLSPGNNVRSGEAYQRLVMRGEPAQAADLEQAPRLHDPAGPSISLAAHPTGAVPVLSFSDHRDFVLAVRCLANRCEAVPVQPTVHAQAISGLIHWGLIREVDRRTRCQILLLHRAPYSSLPADTIPDQPSADRWIELSQIWRLEHELTHIACRRLVGEMRINLYDELVADALGMTAALGRFDADLFRRGLGLSQNAHPNNDARAHVYVSTLEAAHHHQAFQMVLQRSSELETLIAEHQWPMEAMPLLAKLVRGQLNQPLTDGAGCSAASEPDGGCASRA